MKIVLLHGMGGSPADWAEVGEALPGAEAWELPPEPTFDALAETIAGRLHATKEPYCLAGYSLGGRVAIRSTYLLLGANAPRRLALLGAGLGFPGRDDRAARQRQDSAWADLAAKDPPAFWQSWYAQPLFAEFAQVPEAKRASWMRSRLSLDAQTLRRQLEAWSPAQHGLLLPELREIVAEGVSTLYLAGERDKKYQTLARELGREGLKTELIPSAGHLLPLEAPRAVAHALAQHFEGA